MTWWASPTHSSQRSFPPSTKHFRRKNWRPSSPSTAKPGTLPIPIPELALPEPLGSSTSATRSLFESCKNVLRTIDDRKPIVRTGKQTFQTRLQDCFLSMIDRQEVKIRTLRGPVLSGNIVRAIFSTPVRANGSFRKWRLHASPVPAAAHRPHELARELNPMQLKALLVR